MKFPFSWLKEFIDIDSLDPEEVYHKLSMHSVEASCERFSFRSEGVIWGMVETVEPLGEDLNVLLINIGDRKLKVVSAWKDPSENVIVAVAPEGAVVNGNRIRAKKFGDVLSEGILVTYYDLGIDSLKNEPIIGDGNEELGTDVLSSLGEGEYVIELDILPNRGDLLSVRGVAREISALFNKEMISPSYPSYQDTGDISIDIEDEDCYRYRGVIIKDVSIDTSPLLIRKRLFLSGIKIINNIVDITNYIMLQEGQPLHAFDLDKLEGGIVVRSSNKGESIVTLDGEEKRLDEGILVIADRRMPVAVAGVVGGKETGVEKNTKNILLEAAYFNPSRVRSSSKRLGITTDSSYRFERNVDIEHLRNAQDLAVEMMVKFAGGKVVAVKDVYKKPYKPLIIHLSGEKYSKYTGRAIDDRDVLFLKRLGFAPERSREGIKVVVPSYRSFDIKRDVDIIEEIMRGRGYQEYGSEPLYLPSYAERRRDYITEIRNFLISNGLTEVINLPFEDEEDLDPFNRDGKPVEVLNPLNVTEKILRRSLLKSLLRTASYNVSNYNRDMGIFEISRVFSDREELHVGVLLKGYKRIYPEERWTFKDISSIIVGMSKVLDIPMVVELGDIPIFVKDMGGYIYAGDERVGVAGRLSSEITDKYDLDGVSYYLEINLDRVGYGRGIKRYEPLSKYPPVIRDLALLMDKNISVYKLLRDIKSLLGKMVEEVKVFDVYRSDSLGEGKKSVGLRLYMRSYEKSLSNEEVNEIVGELISKLEEKYGVKIR